MVIASVSTVAPESFNLDAIRDELRDYHAHSYYAEVTAVLADAKTYREEQVNSKRVAKRALVLDIDETSLFKLVQPRP